MKVFVSLNLEVDEAANFLSSTPDHHLKDIKEELQSALFDIDDIEVTRIYLEEE